MIRAILFDLDGVLCSSKEIHFRALNDALTAHNCAPVTRDENAATYDGLPTAAKLEILITLGRVRPEDVDSIKALKQKETRRLLESEVRSDPDKFCLLSGLSRRGQKIGVVTNAVWDTAKIILYVMSVRSIVDVVVTNEDGAPKPAPDLYLVAARKLNVDPSECLAVEDGHYGVVAASEAGCRVLQVAGPEEVTPKRIWEALC